MIYAPYRVCSLLRHYAARVVYIKVTFNALLLTKGSSSSVHASDKKLVSRPKVTILISTFKDKFRMTISMIVSSFVKICQVLTILH